MRVSSAVITGIKGEGDTEVKDEESGDIWYETSESKTHLKYNIPEELWGNWLAKEKVYIVCGCKERNFWNYSARELGSVTKPDETIVTVL